MNAPFLKKSLLISACCIATNQVSAADLHSLVQLALQSHPSIQVKRLESAAADQMVTGSIWQMGPGVSFTRGKNMFGQDSNTTRFQQPLFAGGRLLNTVKENSAKRDSLESETIAAEQEIMSRVVDAYADTLRLQKNLKTAQVNVDEHQRLLDMIERRNKSGLSSDNDVVLARMRLQQASSELAQIQAQNQTQRSALEDLISQSLPPLEVLEAIPSKELDIKSLDEARTMALAFAPQIQAQRHRVYASEARTGIERSNLLPQVYLRHEKYSGMGMQNVADQTYVAVEYQFGSGVSSAYSWAAAANQQRGAEAALQNAEKDVTNQLIREWNNYRLTQSQLGLIRLQAQNSTEVRESFLRQYTIGKRNWLDVLNSQREMTSTHYTLSDTEANQFKSQFRVALLTGLLQVSNLSLIQKR